MKPEWWRAAGWVAIGWLTLGWGPARFAVNLTVLMGLAALLVLELVLLMTRQARGDKDRPTLPIGSRPADGVVHVWAMDDVQSLEPLGSTPWRRFVRVEPTGRGRPLPARHPPLLGHIALVSVFVGRDGHGWTDREIRDAHRSLETVGRWLEREAARCSAPLNVGLADTYFHVIDHHDEPVVLDYVAEGGDVGPMELDSTAKSMAGLSRVAALLGFADAADLLAQINARVPADAHAWLLHLKRRGRSHAITAGDGIIRGVGVAICFAREAGFPEPLVGPGRVDPTTVAHELMHLFGASDKYGVPLSDFPSGSVGRRDVMRLDETRLDRLRVSRLTAAEIGWDL